jgi:hypothetical protein
VSFLGNIRAFAPRITRLIGSAVLPGPGKDGRWLRISVTVMVILVIVVAATLSANGSLFATGVSDSASVGLSNSVSISAAPQTLQNGTSLNLIAKITHSFPNAMITVTIKVAGPSGSGISGSKTVTITTNKAGNGLDSVVYPFAQPFVGTASTSVSGTYYVTATFVLVYPVATASTTFTVR